MKKQLIILGLLLINNSFVFGYTKQYYYNPRNVHNNQSYYRNNNYHPYHNIHKNNYKLKRIKQKNNNFFNNKGVLSGYSVPVQKNILQSPIMNQSYFMPKTNCNTSLWGNGFNQSGKYDSAFSDNDFDYKIQRDFKTGVKIIYD